MINKVKNMYKNGLRIVYMIKIRIKKRTMNRVRRLKVKIKEILGKIFKTNQIINRT